MEMGVVSALADVDSRASSYANLHSSTMAFLVFINEIMQMVFTMEEYYECKFYDGKAADGPTDPKDANVVLESKFKSVLGIVRIYTHMRFFTRSLEMLVKLRFNEVHKVLKERDSLAVQTMGHFSTPSVDAKAVFLPLRNGIPEIHLRQQSTAFCKLMLYNGWGQALFFTDQKVSYKFRSKIISFLFSG